MLFLQVLGGEEILQLPKKTEELVPGGTHLLCFVHMPSEAGYCSGGITVVCCLSPNMMLLWYCWELPV